MLVKRISQLIAVLLVSQSYSLLAQDEESLNPTRKPQTYALIVGVSTYKAGIPTLEYADDDAASFADFLRSQIGGNVPDSNIVILLNEQATKKNIKNKLDSIGSVAGRDENRKILEGDKLIYFFSGHGGVIKANNLHFFPFDADPKRVTASSGDTQGKFDTYINMGAILADYNKWAEIGLGFRSILIFDACRNIAVSNKDEGESYEKKLAHYKEGAKKLEQKITDYIVFAASAPGEKAAEDPKLGHGIFTYHLLKGLYGDANNGPKDSVVNFAELKHYVENNVRIYSANRDPNSTPQIPYVDYNDYEQEPFSSELYETLTRSLIDKLDKKIPVKPDTQLGPSASNKIKNKNKDKNKDIKDKALDITIEDFSYSDYRFFFNTAVKEKRLIRPEGDCALYFYKKMAELEPASVITISCKSKLEQLIIDEASATLNNDLIGLRMATQLTRLSKDSKPSSAPAKGNTSKPDETGKKSEPSKKEDTKAASENTSSNDVKVAPVELLGKNSAQQNAEAKPVGTKSTASGYYENALQLLNVYTELSDDTTEAKAIIQYFEIKNLLGNPENRKPIKELVCALQNEYNFDIGFISESDYGQSGVTLNVIEAEFITKNESKTEPFLTYAIAESLVALEQDGLKLKCFNNASGDTLSRLAESFLKLTTYLAPHWSHPLNALGEFYEKKADKAYDPKILRELSDAYYQKAIDINPLDPVPYLNQGDNLFDKSHFHEALRKYMAAYKQDSMQLRTMTSLSQAYANLYKFDEAEKLLQRALEYAPENKDLLYQTGDFYYNNIRDRQRAIQYYKRPTETNPLDLDAWVTLGNFYYSYFDTKYDEAIQSYEKALNLDTTNYDLYKSKGLCYFFKGERNKALEAYRKPIELQPTNDQHYLSLGDFYSNQLGNYNKALSNFEKAIKLNPNNADAYYSSAYAYSGLNNSVKSESCIYMYNNLKQNTIIYNKEIGGYVNPASISRDYNYMAMILTFQNWNSDAYFVTGNFIQQNLPHLRNEAVLNHKLGFFRANSKDYSFYTNLIDLMAIDTSGVINRKGVHEARKFFEKDLKNKQNDANLQYGLAYLYKTYLKDPLKAIEYYKKARKLDPKAFSFVYPEIAACYISAGKIDEAIKTIEKYLSNYPDDPTARWNTGNFFYSTLNDPAKAIQYYEQALVLDSTFMPAYSSIYDYLILSDRKSKLNKARKILEKQHQIDPYNTNYLVSLGNYSLNYSHDTLQAIDYFSKAIAIDTLYGPTNELAAIHLNSGDTATAKQLYALPYNLRPSADMTYGLASNYQYNLKKPEAAMKLYWKAYTMDSLTYRLQNLATLYQELLDYDSAELILKKIISLDSSDYSSFSNLAAQYINLKLYDKAVETYQDGLSFSSIGLQNEYTNPYFDISQVFLQKENGSKADTLMAITYLEKSIQTNKRFFSAYITLGNIYLNQKNIKSAKTWLTKPIKIEPDNPDRYTDAADQLYFNSEDYKSAIKLYNKAVAVEKSTLERYYVIVADCYVYLGKFDDAIAVYDQVLKEFPHKKEELLVAKGEFYKNQGSVAESISIFNQVVQTDYDSTVYTRCMSNLGDAFSQLQQYDSAIYYYSILALEDSAADILYTLAGLYWNVSFQKADQLYMKVFKDPTYSSWVDLFTTGEQFQNAGQPEIASKYFKLAIASPISSTLNIGRSRYYLSEFDKAESTFLELYKQDSVNSETLQWLTLVNVKLNRPDKALEWLKKDMEDQILFYDPRTHAELEELRKTSEFQALIKAYDEK